MLISNYFQLQKKSRKKTILTCLDCGLVIKGGAHLSRHVKQIHNYTSYDESEKTCKGWGGELLDLQSEYDINHFIL